MHAEVESSEFALGVGGVDGDEVEVLEFGGDDAAFRVEFVDAQSVGDFEWGNLGKDGGARVAGFIGGVPVSLVGAEFEWEFDLFGSGLGFLEAEDVGLFGADEVGESFLQGGADAVDVPADEFHVGELLVIDYPLLGGEIKVERGDGRREGQTPGKIG